MKKIEFPSWDGYTQTRHSLLAICQLDAAAAQILNLFLNPMEFMIETENRVRLSLREIEEFSGYSMSRHRIIEALKSLEKLGYIHKKKYETLANVYQINFEAIQIAINDLSSRTECTKILQDRAQKCSKTVLKSN